jgi:hypothetical protein
MLGFHFEKKIIDGGIIRSQKKKEKQENAKEKKKQSIYKNLCFVFLVNKCKTASFFVRWIQYHSSLSGPLYSMNTYPFL